MTSEFNKYDMVPSLRSESYPSFELDLEPGQDSPEPPPLENAALLGWSGYDGPANARRLTVFCEGGRSTDPGEGTRGTSSRRQRHDEVHVATLVELCVSDGHRSAEVLPEAIRNGGGSSWVFEEAEHTTVQVMRGPDSGMLTDRTRIDCPQCQQTLTIGDTLGVGYTTATREGSFGYVPLADSEPYWARAARHSELLTQFANGSSVPRLSLVGLRTILATP